MAMRVQSKPKKSRESRGGNRSSTNYANDPYHDEGSDDENAISLAAIKNKYKKQAAGGGVSKRKNHVINCQYNLITCYLYLFIIYFSGSKHLLIR